MGLVLKALGFGFVWGLRRTNPGREGGGGGGWLALATAKSQHWPSFLTQVSTKAPNSLVIETQNPETLIPNPKP